MRKLPNTYVLIAALILLCAVLTWFVPGGQYVTADDGTLSYQSVPAAPQTWQIFSAIYHGFVKQAGIIVFILVVGGAFWLLNATGAVSAGISRFIGKVGKRDKLVLAAITVLFSLAGAVFGMSEETIPFVGIVVPLVVSMGYDAFMGMLVVYVASNIGFSSAFLNPFTVGIAQGMADLPLFSGMGYRLICWAFFTVLLVVAVWIYARRSKKAAPEVECPPDTSSTLREPLTKRQGWILAVLGLTVVALIVGVTCWDWYMPEITALFLVMGIVCGIIAGFSANKIADELIAGARDILSAALVVGFASGIIVILQDGHIVDSILHGMQEGLDGTGPMASLSAMYGIQALINFLIPSATAKAAITIPIMAPFADMVGVSRQAMVLAFQFGDGFTNMLTPTSGVLMAALAMARIPYSRWLAWIWKAVLVLLVLGLLLLIPTLWVW
ncbi:MAG: YfcC family protein [Bacteroidales bacterium]|nr:YfcC family protein [Bacteroidales bacterium]MCR4569376.1 AbgT family transporter [Bacteroidales bacterium]